MLFEARIVHVIAVIDEFLERISIWFPVVWCISIALNRLILLLQLT